MTKPAVTLGATYLGQGRCRFRVWSPSANKVEVHITSPEERVVSLRPTPCLKHCSLS
ncbi:MAG: hypothetical protein HY671_00555 [Chloroflexi bacterium]|nr:hypothetical protein [Chloroflexota bacterium]